MHEVLIAAGGFVAGGFTTAWALLVINVANENARRAAAATRRQAGQ